MSFISPDRFKQLSLQSLIFLAFFMAGIIPLLISVSVNLPQVLKQFEKAADERKLVEFQRQLFWVNHLIESQKDHLRILSMMSEVHDFLKKQDSAGEQFRLRRQRLTSFLGKWFNPGKEVLAVEILGQKHSVALHMERDGQGMLTCIQDSGNTCLHMPELPVSSSLKRDSIFWADVSVNSSGDGWIKGSSLILGMPICLEDDSVNGFVFLKLDLKSLLQHLNCSFLIKTDGTYFYPQGKIDTENAFSQFKALRSHVLNNRPVVLASSTGGKVAWLPVIPGDGSVAGVGLWAGSIVDDLAIEQWVQGFVVRLVVLVLLITCIHFFLAIRLARFVDNKKQSLLQGLRRLFDKGEAFDFRWFWPRELKELGRDLSVLSARYLETDRARRRAEAELQDLSSQQSTILNSAAEGILRIDSEGNVIFANPAAVDMMGFSREEILGADLHCLVHFLRPDRSQYPKEDCPFCQAIRTGTYKKIGEDVFFRKDGSKIHVQYVTAPILNGTTQGQGVVMCIRDITKQKEAEAKTAKLHAQLLQAQKMEAIGTLAGGVAHDFNNLLTAITGYSELMLQHLEPQNPLYNHTRAILDAAGRAGDLTRQLLAFSRKQQMVPQVVDLNALIVNMEKMLCRIIGEDIELLTELADDGCFVKGDPGMLEQVLMNLVVNARDAMPDGGRILIRTGTHTVKKACKAMPLDVKGEFVCMCVEDNGEGMDSEVQKRVFDPFFTTKPQGRGTGLGLSVVYGIVEQHKGWLNVRSELGKGSVFTVCFPLYHAEKGRKSVSDVENEQRLPRATGERILLVEDEEEVSSVVEEILVEHGYQVFAAFNLAEAFNLFNSGPGQFDLVISDVVLPDGSGINFTDYVHSQTPDLPVLVYSGYADDKSQLSIIMERNLPFLRKPFSRFDLLSTIHRLIREHKSRRLTLSGRKYS